jgi:hypothetical protein
VRSECAADMEAGKDRDWRQSLWARNPVVVKGRSGGDEGTVGSSIHRVLTYSGHDANWNTFANTDRLDRHRRSRTMHCGGRLSIAREWNEFVQNGSWCCSRNAQMKSVAFGRRLQILNARIRHEGSVGIA